MKKRIVLRALALALLMALLVPSALAVAAKIKKVEYEGAGRVEVDFKKDVQYRKAKLTVKDGSGKKVSATIVNKDDDDLDFIIQSVKPDTRYSFTLSGVRAGKSGKFGKVKGSFVTPGDKTTKVAIKDVDYDADDRELEVEFAGRVQYKKVRVVVTDARGKTYTVRIRRKKSDELKLKVKGLKAGATYTVKVSGVRLKGTHTYQSVSRTFVAVDD